MENKYYVPKISEFHVGFEYERNEPHREYYKENSPTKYKWVEKKWDESQIRLGKLRYEIFDKNIRTKYLDASDIESFGFKENPFNNKMLLHFTKEIEGKTYWEIFKHTENNAIEIAKVVGGFNLFPFKKFEGFIKNKSELKKVLQMIGVLEDDNV